MSAPLPRNSRTLLAIAMAALLVFLGGLLAAFLFSLASASRHFDRAAAAQAQMAAVARIEAIAAAGFPRRQLVAALRDYGSSIARETTLLPPGSREQAAQRAEAMEARRLAALALTSADRGAMRGMVARIAARERAEVAQVEDALRGLRRRTSWLAILLAAGSLAAAALGAFLLLRANRDLGREVDARTAELQAVDRSRRLFFAKASHELRTPVTVMRGEAEVTLSDPHASVADLRQSLAHVAANADFLGRRIEELLGLSKADDGQLALSIQPVSLTQLVRASVEGAQGYARSADVRIDLSAPGAPLRLSGDGRWLGQALLAVIDNGVKFSPQNAALHVALTAQGDRAAIAVTDHGPGMLAEELPRIFDAYYQTEEGRMRGGTGLGLALARWVVEQHGGTIMAANDPAGGCQIRIELPLEGDAA